MPYEVDRLPDMFGDHMVGVVITIGTREDYDTKFQASISTRYSSMMGFDNTSRAMRATDSRACSSFNESSSAISKYFPCRISAIPLKPNISTECWIALP